MQEIETKRNVINVYTAITSILKPNKSSHFIQDLVEEVTNKGKEHNLQVQNYTLFKPISYFKDEEFCAFIEIQFGGKNSLIESCHSIAYSGALVGVLLTSSNSQGPGMSKLMAILAEIKGTTNKFIIYDIETGKHMLHNIDPTYNNKYLYKKTTIFRSPRKFKTKTTPSKTHKRKKIIHGKR